MGGTKQNLELLLAGVLLGGNLANHSVVRRLSKVWTLPVPPLCSSELSFNTDKWASRAHKARAILWLRRLCKYHFSDIYCCIKSPYFMVLFLPSVLINQCKKLGCHHCRGHISLTAKNTKMAATRSHKKTTSVM